MPLCLFMPAIRYSFKSSPGDSECANISLKLNPKSMKVVDELIFTQQKQFMKR